MPKISSYDPMNVTVLETTGYESAVEIDSDAMGIEVDKTEGANEPPAEEEVERFETRSLPNIEQTETCGGRE